MLAGTQETMSPSLTQVDGHFVLRRLNRDISYMLENEFQSPSSAEYKVLDMHMIMAYVRRINVIGNIIILNS